MDVKEAILGRRAVRAYTREPVREDTLHRLIDAAVCAPSAVNEQPWTFAVVRDQGLLNRVSDAAKSHMLPLRRRVTVRIVFERNSAIRTFRFSITRQP